MPVRTPRGPACAGLGQSEEFAPVLMGNSGIGGDREIPVMHLVDHCICKRAELRATVPGPAFGVGAAEIHYCRPLPVGSDCGGENTGSLVEPPAGDIDPEGVEPSCEVSVCHSAPGSVSSIFLHVNDLIGMSSESFFI